MKALWRHLTPAPLVSWVTPTGPGPPGSPGMPSVPGKPMNKN